LSCEIPVSKSKFSPFSGLNFLPEIRHENIAACLKEVKIFSNIPWRLPPKEMEATISGAIAFLLFDDDLETGGGPLGPIAQQTGASRQGVQFQRRPCN
jgi:hypothetical protein